uniref:Serum response factor n=1 Tax=Pinctada imbricata TaxID=66713 RepID=A0A0D3RXX7_PINIB|nr:serum response factor [Pinctada imbricata]
MQSSSQSLNSSKLEGGQLSEMNGTHMNQPAFPTLSGGAGMQKFTMEQVDPTSLDDDSDSEDGQGAVPNIVSHGGLKPGKKTKGRVKIKMEFIENKLRRYTTFSKRKTGIMKKAYELSTLTGTQVMLLVASETGHVYTFATRKLQPMITSESGKALIQTCLNSPDPPPGSQPQISSDQRMNPTGFEETELTYAVSEDETAKIDGSKTMFAMPGMTNLPTSISAAEPGLVQNHSSSPTPAQMTYGTTGTPVAQQVTQAVATVAAPASSTANNGNKASGNVANVASLQLPQMPPGTVMLAPGTPLIPLQQNGQQVTQQAGQQQTLYRLTNSNQLVSLPTTATSTGIQPQQQQQPATQQPVISSSGDTNTSTCTLTNVNPATLNQNSATQAMTPGVVMYQTPQGIVYAPTAATLQDRSIFNFQQPATALSLSQTDGQQQQIITIPVPVTLSGSPQVLQFAAQGSETSTPVTLSQPTPAKKSRK